MLLQIAAEAHPLHGTVAEWMWLLPILPLLGFLINGGLALLSVVHVGPADPDMGHHQGAEGAEIAHAENAGAHGDDHHAVKRHKYAGIVSIIGPLVLVLSFLLAFAIFQQMRSIPSMEAPFVQNYFSWMPAGDLQIDASFQLDQLSMVMVLIITGVGPAIASGNQT